MFVEFILRCNRRRVPARIPASWCDIHTMDTQIAWRYRMRIEYYPSLVDMYLAKYSKYSRANETAATNYCLLNNVQLKYGTIYLKIFLLNDFFKSCICMKFFMF